MFRIVVQDSRRTPTSGKVVASLGSYDPHAKTLAVDKDKASFYLEHGAQPSDRAAHLLKSEGVKLPKWVHLQAEQKRAVRQPDKRRSTRPVTETAEPDAADSEPAAETAVTPESPDLATEDKVADETSSKSEVAETADASEATPETDAAKDDTSGDTDTADK